MRTEALNELHQEYTNYKNDSKAGGWEYVSWEEYQEANQEEEEEEGGI